MLRFVALIALAGCGRIDFAKRPDSGLAGDGSPGDVLLGHDEDGDGVPDVDDVCPHIADSQADNDGDRVGDDCDPNPSAGGETITLFLPMTGQNPFTIGPLTDGVFTQLADSLRFDGTLGGDQNLFGQLLIDSMQFGDVRVAVGFDVTMIVPGSASDQNQLALVVYDQAPNYFVELNQIPALFDNAQVTYFDGSTFSQANSMNLANGIHTGALFLQTTQRVNSGVRLDAGWPGEPYSAEVNDTVYQGATKLELNFNNVHFEIRWLIVITSQ